jgi:hypothetical protein
LFISHPDLARTASSIAPLIGGALFYVGLVTATGILQTVSTFWALLIRRPCSR